MKIEEFSKFQKTLLPLVEDIFIVSELRTLFRHIKRLVKKSGWNFTYLYLKKCMKLTIFYISGSKAGLLPGRGVQVQITDDGIPSIIPITLRSLIREHSKNVLVVKMVLTILGMYRIFETKPEPSISSIVKPFWGETETLEDIQEAVEEIFNITRIGNLNFELISKNSVGPNHTFGSMGASYDALAFIYNWNALKHWAIFMYSFKQYYYLTWVLLIIIIAGPLLIMLNSFEEFKKHYKIGKLSCVYDQAGKARVVAVTSYWTQLALRPLHDKLYSVLKTLEEDGTFNQEGPLNRLVKRDSSEDYYCFDLSAATDRLPIKLQAQILNIVSEQRKLGDLWMSLINSIDWWWREKGSKVEKCVKYSVGQPMGTYSSWAMLSITHHIIVRYAALKVGIKNFKEYAILGDDIVIRNCLVAYEYANTMEILGVHINSYKTLVSSDFAEFAKKLRGKDIDYTPLGAGLVLRAVRYNYFLPVMYKEAFENNMIQNFPQLLNLISDSSNPSFSLWSVIGLKHAIAKDQRYVFTNLWRVSSNTLKTLPIYAVGTTILQFLFREYLEEKSKVNEEFLFFKENWWKKSYIKDPLMYSPWRLLETLLKIIGPTRTIMTCGYKRAIQAYSSGSYEKNLITAIRFFQRVRFTQLELIELFPYMLDLSNRISWDNLIIGSKKDAKEFGSSTKKLLKTFESNFAVMSRYHDIPLEQWKQQSFPRHLERSLLEVKRDLERSGWYRINNSIPETFN